MDNLKIKKKYIKNKNKSLIPIYYISNSNNNNKIIIIIKNFYKINNSIKNICKNIYKYNYIIIIPKLLYKIKNNNISNNNKKKIKNKKNFISDRILLSDINNIINWSKKKFNTNKVGITGFSWGGRLTWLYSYFYDYNIKTSVIWYGKLIDKINNKHPIHPIDIGCKIKIPILGLYSNENKIISINLINKMKKKIKKKNKNNKIIIFKNQYYNFFNKNKKNYNKKISQKAFKKMINWFNKYIK